MSTLTIKNIPERLHQLLKERAEQHHRSLNNEVIACLETAMKSRKIEPETLLAHARLLRSKISGSLTNRDLYELKNQGRP